MWETGSPARRRANRAFAARALDESIASSAWAMSRTRSQPRTEQSNNSASNRGNPDSHSKPPIVAPVSTAFTPGPLFSALFGERGELLGLVLCEHRLRLFLVLVLRAGVLALHHDSGWKMRDSHRRVGLVDVLAAGPRGAESVDAKVRGIQYDVADCARLGQYGDRAGRGVDAALGFGGRHSLDAMAAGVEFELGVGALPDNARDDLLVPAGIARRFGYPLHLPALAFRIARIHAK